MAKTMGGERCRFCQLVHEHWPGCPAEVGTPEAEAVYNEAYRYAYWHKDIREEILKKRSATFLIGYRSGKTARDYHDWQDKEEKFERQQGWRRIRGW